MRNVELPRSAAAAAIPLVLAVAACAQAWSGHGSIASGDWLGYAVLAAFLVAVVVLAGAARPTRGAATGLGLLFAFAAWQLVSASWSPVPALGRDDALLTALFATSVAATAFALTTPAARLGGLWVATLAFGGLASAAALAIAFGAHPLDRFYVGRLYFPITYSNAQAALFLAGFWPGVVLAGRRGAAVAARAAALGAAAAMLAAAVLAQSKGSLLGLAVAAVVVSAVSPARLRLLLAAVLAALPSAVLFHTLTAPFRAPASVTTARHAAEAVLVAAVVGAVLGTTLALVDRRLDLTARRQTIGRTAAALAATAAVVAVAVFFVAAGSPSAWVSSHWASFKTYSATNDQGGSHFSELGSNRYDFWRAATRMFERHPLAGCGARCFGPEYLLDRRSPERPQRSHSLFFDTAAEEGIVGLVLLVGGFAALLVATGRRARARSGPAIAALAATVGFLTECAVDWTWTFAAVGIAYALVLGAGLADRSRGLLEGRRRAVGTALAVALAIAGFAPPWIAAHLTSHALAGGPGATADLRWAHRLDPLSTAPLIAEASIATTAGAELRALRAAVNREPRVVANRYFLGSALLNLGRRPEARAQLERALALDPGNVSVELALARAR